MGVTVGVGVSVGRGLCVDVGRGVTVGGICTSPSTGVGEVLAAAATLAGGDGSPNSTGERATSVGRQAANRRANSASHSGAERLASTVPRRFVTDLVEAAKRPSQTGNSVILFNIVRLCNTGELYLWGLILARRANFPSKLDLEMPIDCLVSGGKAGSTNSPGFHFACLAVCGYYCGNLVAFDLSISCSALQLITGQRRRK